MRVRATVRRKTNTTHVTIFSGAGARCNLQVEILLVEVAQRAYRQEGCSNTLLARAPHQHWRIGDWGLGLHHLNHSLLMLLLAGPRCFCAAVGGAVGS